MKADILKKSNNGVAEQWLVKPESPYEGHEYFIVSAAILTNNQNYRFINLLDHMMGSGSSDRETYLFAADADGTVISWSELEGSQKGTVDIVQVLTDAGFEVNEV